MQRGKIPLLPFLCLLVTLTQNELEVSSRASSQWRRAVTLRALRSQDSWSHRVGLTAKLCLEKQWNAHCSSPGGAKGRKVAPSSQAEWWNNLSGKFWVPPAVFMASMCWLTKEDFNVSGWSISESSTVAWRRVTLEAERCTWRWTKRTVSVGYQGSLVGKWRDSRVGKNTAGTWIHARVLWGLLKYLG